VFPVRGVAAFAREFRPPRHMGVDIFADRGTPIVAPDDGRVRFGVEPRGGNVFYLATADGTHWFGAHLDAIQGQDRMVKAGDVLGYVGTTGNAAHTQPHLHLEKHGIDGAAVDPYDDLDAIAGLEVKRGAAALPAPAPGAAPAPAPAASTASISSRDGWLLLLGLWWLNKRKARR